MSRFRNMNLRMKSGVIDLAYLLNKHLKKSKKKVKSDRNILNKDKIAKAQVTFFRNRKNVKPHLEKKFSDSNITKLLKKIQDKKIDQSQISKDNDLLSTFKNNILEHKKTRASTSFKLRGCKSYEISRNFNLQSNGDNSEARNTSHNSEFWNEFVQKLEQKENGLHTSHKQPVLDLQQSVWGLKFLGSDQYFKKNYRYIKELRYKPRNIRFLSQS
ncbi:unnamed protein product [Moneuplotes crassus]|uniref:Uncharacterized protein n=1 Tax=Euplotes crassus TaxID=5936 RepID=A0AAD1UL47_EUPCR|nr:unnamed protein product [Moneuplotes crassus]